MQHPFRRSLAGPLDMEVAAEGIKGSLDAPCWLPNGHFRQSDLGASGKIAMKPLRQPMVTVWNCSHFQRAP
ncbi:hypothetical protein OCOJLMKI_0495 [Methylobacterium iners]|uniref:Uncharacterized protein n=1 Tax=Methylobacterium iners TaxID=418707 RepID=A0ABQ4RSX8_9HYPH|nr:hypothetical protein OCOJLMKI_0495 [Methylobacterium iners]